MIFKFSLSSIRSKCEIYLVHSFDDRCLRRTFVHHDSGIADKFSDKIQYCARKQRHIEGNFKSLNMQVKHELTRIAVPS